MGEDAPFPIGPARPVGWRGVESRHSHTSPSACAGAVYALDTPELRGVIVARWLRLRTTLMDVSAWLRVHPVDQGLLFRIDEIKAKKQCS
jgi:hypothetical protein